VEVLRGRARDQPDRRAYTFLVDGETVEVHLAFGELDRQARAIAALLRERVSAGERVLLLYPPGVEYIAAFFGCLYAGVVAVPAFPPRAGRGLGRLTAVIADARPTVVLAAASIKAVLEEHVHAGRWPAELVCLATDAVTLGGEGAWQPPLLTGETLAVVQYTSGSTGAPKGVMLTHANLLANSALIHWRYAHSPESRGVMWVPPYHDMGLVGGILQPAYGGFPVTLLPPMTFLQRPLRWLQAISRTRATTSAAPSFAYDLCVERTTAEQRAALDLRSWRIAAIGAEPIRAEVLDRFALAFGPCGFRRDAFLPSFGLAEATLMVTGGPIDRSPVVRAFNGRALVGCGPSLPGQRVRIVDALTMRPCSAEQTGEIWVAGPSVAAGYWQRPELSRDTFGARLAGTCEGPFLRTGDLGFLDGHDELFVTGRLKDLIVLPGRKLYPEDLELCAGNSHAALSAERCAAFGIEGDGVERLAIAAEVRPSVLQPGVDQAAIVRAIRGALVREHDVRADTVVLLRSGGLPRTTSGKLQRHACRAALLAGTLDIWQPLGHDPRRVPHAHA
jgi:acyl-CoA synthetase (AMP-forming)/AMP-acid ligase II